MLYTNNSNNWPGSFQEKCTIVSGRRTTTEPPVAMIVHLSDSGDIKKTAILFCAIHIVSLIIMHNYVLHINILLIELMNIKIMSVFYFNVEVLELTFMSCSIYDIS